MCLSGTRRKAGTKSAARAGDNSINKKERFERGVFARSNRCYFIHAIAPAPPKLAPFKLIEYHRNCSLVSINDTVQKGTKWLRQKHLPVRIGSGRLCYVSLSIFRTAAMVK